MIVRVIVGGEHHDQRSVETAVYMVGDDTFKHGPFEDAI